MISRKKSVWSALCLLLAGGLVGCTTRAGALVTNAQFVYPNSNVETLGAVSATQSKTGWYSLPMLKMEDLEALYRQALAQKNGDILVNATFETKTTAYPLIIIAIYKVTYSISGTAAKMTVGQKKIGELIKDDLESMARKASLDVPVGAK